MLDPRGPAWAVRCFYTEVPDLQQRYAAISRILPTVQSPYITGFEYQEQGILVSSKWYPIVKMPWITGDTLCVYIVQHLSEPGTLWRLAEEIRHMASALERAGVAHGDLQEGNILVSSAGDLKLVDYDGFYVPSLKGQLSSNLGLPDYQHPRRSVSDFGPTMDRFSTLVLYLGLAGLASAQDPKSLWRRFSPGDANVLLAQKDFLHPDTSPLLTELEQTPGLAAMVRSFRSICKGTFGQVPSLEDFIAAPQVVPAPSRALTPVVARRPFPVVAADDYDQLMRLEGTVVEVVGKVAHVNYDPSRLTVRNQPYAHMNLGHGDYRNGCFVIPLWWDVLEPLLSAGNAPHDFERQWISITGLLKVYRNQKDPWWRPQPQIVPSWYGNIAVLSRADTMSRLAGGSPLQSPPPSISGTVASLHPPVSSTTISPALTPIAMPATSPENIEEEMRRAFQKASASTPLLPHTRPSMQDTYPSAQPTSTTVPPRVGAIVQSPLITQRIAHQKPPTPVSPRRRIKRFLDILMRR